MQKSRVWKRLRIKAIYARDGALCHYCGRPLAALDEIPDLIGGPLPDDFPTLDHVVPRSKGGGHALRNLVVSCFPCNRTKGDRHDRVQVQARRRRRDP